MHYIVKYIGSNKRFGTQHKGHILLFKTQPDIVTAMHCGLLMLLVLQPLLRGVSSSVIVEHWRKMATLERWPCSFILSDPQLNVPFILTC